MSKREDIIQLVENAKEILSNDKKKVYSALYQLKQVAVLLDDDELNTWVSLELGDPLVTSEVEKILNIAIREKENEEKLKFPKTILDSKPFDFTIFITSGEADHKLSPSSGGFQSIEVIENLYDTTLKKSGNNGTEYKSNVLRHLAVVRNIALEKTIKLYNQMIYSDSVRDGFDVLKEKIDDRLLDLNPVVAEQLMLSFKNMNSSISEERSHALTTARRFLKELADTIYPAKKTEKGKRKLGEEQYINRIWAFMDEAIESKVDKENAKSLVDLIGLNIQNLYKGTNKGVHGDVTHIQSVLFIFQIYIMVGYLLDYLDLPNNEIKNKININRATLDELESALGINRKIAKNIIKFRVLNGNISEMNLLDISGVGKVTVRKAKEAFDFE